MRNGKIFVFFVAVSLLSVNTLTAQKLGLYGSLGYGFARGSHHWTSSETYEEEGEWDYYELTDREDHYLSIGTGAKLNGGLQVGITPNLAIRVGGGYSHMMPSLEAEDDYPDQSNPDTENYKAHILNFHGIFVVGADCGTVRPYAGAGAGLFFGSMKERDTYFWHSWEGSEVKNELEIEYRFQPAIGFIGLLGVEFPVMGDNIALFGELNLQQVSFTIDKRELVEYKVDGKDELDEIDPEDRKEEYEKNDIDKPPPWVMPGSSFGIRMGLNIGIM